MALVKSLSSRYPYFFHAGFSWWNTAVANNKYTDLTKLRRRRQGERKKSNRFNEQNNNSARASRFFVHFFAVPAQLRPEMTNFLAELSRAPAEHCGK